MKTPSYLGRIAFILSLLIIISSVLPAIPSTMGLDVHHVIEDSDVVIVGYVYDIKNDEPQSLAINENGNNATIPVTTARIWVDKIREFKGDAAEKLEFLSYINISQMIIPPTRGYYLVFLKHVEGKYVSAHYKNYYIATEKIPAYVSYDIQSLLVNTVKYGDSRKADLALCSLSLLSPQAAAFTCRESLDQDITLIKKGIILKYLMALDHSDDTLQKGLNYCYYNKNNEGVLSEIRDLSSEVTRALNKKYADSLKKTGKEYEDYDNHLLNTTFSFLIDKRGDGLNNKPSLIYSQAIGDKLLITPIENISIGEMNKINEFLSAHLDNYSSGNLELLQDTVKRYVNVGAPSVTYLIGLLFRVDPKERQFVAQGLAAVLQDEGALSNLCDNYKSLTNPQQKSIIVESMASLASNVENELLYRPKLTAQEFGAKIIDKWIEFMIDQYECETDNDVRNRIFSMLSYYGKHGLITK